MRESHGLQVQLAQKWQSCAHLLLYQMLYYNSTLTVHVFFYIVCYDGLIIIRGSTVSIVYLYILSPTRPLAVAYIRH